MLDRTAGLAMVILLLSACPSLNPPILFQEDFEGCKDACGWAVTGTGTATTVTTIHPGEHGLRLDGDVTVTRMFEPPIEAASLGWVSDGHLRTSVTLDDDAGDIDVTAIDPTMDENGDPLILPDGGFLPRNAGFGGQLMAPVRSLSFHHLAGFPPVIIDVVTLVGINTNPGCY